MKTADAARLVDVSEATIRQCEDPCDHCRPDEWHRCALEGHHDGWHTCQGGVA